MSASILDRIMARKREEVASKRRQTPEWSWREQAQEATPPRGFAMALAQRIQAGDPAIIAEVKRASPSKGRIHPGADPFDPAGIAQGYAEHGAACLSCLTDRDFQGEDGYLTVVRERVTIPVLRKDFLYDPYQVVESRALGADAVLLILAVLSRDQARELEDAAMTLGMDCLLEVHNPAELEVALPLRSTLLGINNRDLQSFVTRLETTEELSRMAADPSRLMVSESGIDHPEKVARLRRQGIHAFLIGEFFMKETNPGAALGRFLADCRACY